MRQASRIDPKGAALMRSLLTALRCAFVISILAAGASVSAWAQAGFDRPGGDYTRFVVPSGDPAVCAARCEREGRCRAWAFSYPGTGGGTTRDVLAQERGEAGGREPVLRVRHQGRGPGGEEKRPGGNVDRPHRRRLPLTSNCRPIRPANPARKPARERTAAGPGPTCGPAIGNSGSRCFLKDKITPPRRKPCCMSGVVR